MGSPTAATPARNHGARKPIPTLPPNWLLAAGYRLLSLEFSFPDRQILAESVIQRTAGVDQEIIDPRPPRARLDVLNVPLNLRWILVRHVIGRNLQRVAG